MLHRVFPQVLIIVLRHSSVSSFDSMKLNLDILLGYFHMLIQFAFI